MCPKENLSTGTLDLEKTTCLLAFRVADNSETTATKLVWLSIYSVGPMEVQGSSLAVQTPLPLGHLDGRGALERLTLRANLPRDLSKEAGVILGVYLW